VFSTMLFGRLSDKVGRKPVYLTGSLLVMAFAFPMFLLVNTGNSILIVLVYVIGMAVIHDSLAGTQGAWFSELFDTNTRSSGASIGYQFSAAISGFIPLIATAVAIPLGWGGVALVYMGVGLLGVIGTLVTKETWGPARRAEIDAIINRS